VSERWYILKDGKEHGPTSFEKLKQLADKEKITAQDQVCREGEDWRAASKVAGLGLEPATTETKQPSNSSENKYPNLDRYLRILDSFADLLPALAILVSVVCVGIVAITSDSVETGFVSGLLVAILGVVYSAAAFLLRFFLKVGVESARVVVDIEKNTRQLAASSR
jgi:hypothetical protein